MRKRYIFLLITALRTQPSERALWLDVSKFVTLLYKTRKLYQFFIEWEKAKKWYNKIWLIYFNKLLKFAVVVSLSLFHFVAKTIKFFVLAGGSY